MTSIRLDGRRGLIVVLGLAVAAVVIGYGAQMWSRSYADGGPQTTRLTSVDPAALASKTYLIDCAHQPVVRPRQFTVTCGDANEGLERLHWTQWGGAKAKATGRYVENTCTPYCAAGHFKRYRAEITATHLLRKDGTGRYRTIVVHFPGKHPSWVKHHRASFDIDYYNFTS